MRDYPKLLPFTDKTIKEIYETLKFIIQERKSDIRDNSNLTNIFVSGRKSGKIPSSSTDITADDKVGDINYDVNYLYICVDNSGTAVWRRVALTAW